MDTLCVMTLRMNWTAIAYSHTAPNPAARGIQGCIVPGMDIVPALAPRDSTDASDLNQFELQLFSHLEIFGINWSNMTYIYFPIWKSSESKNGYHASCMSNWYTLEFWN